MVPGTHTVQVTAGLENSAEITERYPGNSTYIYKRQPSGSWASKNGVSKFLSAFLFANAETLKISGAIPLN